MSTATNTRTSEYITQPGLKLSLTNITATVRITPNSTAHVAVTGDDDYRKAVTVAYDPAENRLAVSEEPGCGGGAVVVSSGSVQVNRFGPGGSYSSVTSVGRGSVVSTGSGGVFIGGHVGGRIVVNGVDVTDQVNAASGAQAVGERTITIHVPTGTDIGADDCTDVTVRGIGGRVRASLSGHGRLDVEDATGARLRVKGQSTAVITKSSGTLDLHVSGQSTIRVGGDFGDVNLTVSGQSSVRGSGTFGHVGGEVSGQSDVHLAGQASGQSVRSSGQSSVSIPAPVRRQASSGGWDF